MHSISAYVILQNLKSILKINIPRQWKEYWKFYERLITGTGFKIDTIIKCLKQIQLSRIRSSWMEPETLPFRLWSCENKNWCVHKTNKICKREYTIYIGVLFGRYAESNGFLSVKDIQNHAAAVDSGFYEKYRVSPLDERSFRRFSRCTPTVNEFVRQTVKMKLPVRDFKYIK